MRVVVETELACDADAAWREVRTCRLLQEVAAPLATIAGMPHEPLPAIWPNGRTVRCRIRLFGFLPLGTHTIHFERIDGAARQIQSRETDALVRQWDHLITITPLGAGRCRYRDDVTVRAGILTPAVWLFAHVFYRHRQCRWRHVAERIGGAEPRTAAGMATA